MTNKIKKLIYLVLVLIMCVGILCACNNDDDFRNPRNGEPESGEFYTLQEAYDNGWLSKGELKSIAYYLNSKSQEEGFVPIAKDPETLSEELDLAIREDYAKLLRDGNYPEAVADDISVHRYYGTYEDMRAIWIDVAYFGYADVITTKYVGDVKFIYPCRGVSVLLWKSNRD